MGEVKSIIEQVARELCRWDGKWKATIWRQKFYEPVKTRYRREARKLVKMVCGSCGLAKPLMEGK